MFAVALVSSVAILALNSSEIFANNAAVIQKTQTTSQINSQGVPGDACNIYGDTGCFDVVIKFSNYSVPPVPTTYACNVYDIRQLISAQGLTANDATSYYAVEFSPIKDNQLVLHHMLLFAITTLTDVNIGNVTIFSCESMPSEINGLKINAGPIWGYAPGGNNLILPPAVAFKVSSTIRYFILQMHYNNPSSISGYTDSSGLTLRLTPNSRPNLAAFMFLGMDIPTISLPPFQSNITFTSTCNTSTLLPPPFLGYNINVFSAAVHMHYLGKVGFVDLVKRNGTVIRLIQDYAYSFGNQRFQPVSTLLTVGDIIQASCTWDTSTINITTVGGENTSNEMCLFPILYYPQTTVSGCLPVHN